MFEQTKSILTISILAAAAAACSGAPPAAEDEPASASSAPDMTESFSADGLAFEKAMNDEVAGRFERHGVAIRFDVARKGMVHTLTVQRDSGETILESTMHDGLDSSVFLGGQATLKGQVGQEPTLDGDQVALEKLMTSPEGQLVAELKEALIARHVEHGLLYAEATPTANRVGIQSWFDGTYWHLAYGETFGFWSWSWWGVTTVVIAREQNPYGGYSAAWFRAGAAGPEYVGGYGMQSYRRQWWGAYVTVGNNLLPLSGQNTTMIARSY